MLYGICNSGIIAFRCLYVFAVEGQLGMDLKNATLEQVTWELEESIKREKALEDKVKDITERLDSVEKTLLKANIAGMVGFGMLSLMGALLAWVVTHIDYLAKLLGTKQ